MSEARAVLRLPSGQLLPPLRVVDAEAVRLHEDADPRRVEALVERLRQEDVLRNPPVAAPLPRGGYVVLDGANRTVALRRLELPAHVLQVVDYADAAVRLEVWHHLLQEDGDVLAALPPARVERLTGVEVLLDALATRRAACGLVTPDGVWGVRDGGALQERVRAVRALVSAYAGRQAIYRVPTPDLPQLAAEYGRVAAVAVFPPFAKEEILRLAELPEKLPTGVTRHVIPNRVLRLNLPLDILRGANSLEAKNAALHELLHARLLAHRVRYYAEPTLLLDE